MGKPDCRESKAELSNDFVLVLKDIADGNRVVAARTIILHELIACIATKLEPLKSSILKCDNVCRGRQSWGRGVGRRGFHGCDDEDEFSGLSSVTR